MSSVLKPAIPQGAQTQAPTQNAVPKNVLSSAAINHNAQPHIGTTVPQPQNMTHHQQNSREPPSSPHPLQNMTHITQNMAQMAQNMSHHGNLSHISQPTPPAISTYSPVSCPVPVTVGGKAINLAQEKLNEGLSEKSQPLALNRLSDNKELEPLQVKELQSNGTSEPSASSPNSTVSENAKLPSSNINQSISKCEAQPISSSIDTSVQNAQAPKPLEVSKEASKKGDDLVQVNKLESTTDSPVQVTKTVAPAESTNSEKSEMAADKDKKEDSIEIVKKAIDSSNTENGSDIIDGSSPITISEDKSNSSQDSSGKDAASSDGTDKVTSSDGACLKPKVDAITKDTDPQTKLNTNTNTTKIDKAEKTEEKAVDSKKDIEVKSPSKVIQKEVSSPTKPVVAKAEPPKSPSPRKVEPKATKSTLKLATVVTPTARKRRQESKTTIPGEGPSPAKKSVEHVTGDSIEATPSTSTPDSRLSKRNRTKVQPYQSPTPDIAMATKLSASTIGRATPPKQQDDKLIVFYKNEYLAVRNADGGFYVCQTMQNVYRSSRKIKIRWLSQDKTLDPTGEIYKPDFYDTTDMECVLTTLSLARAAGGGGAQRLAAAEAARAASILARALALEKGEAPPPDELTPEHPDGLDLSLYTEESQLDKKRGGAGRRQGRKRPSSTPTKRTDSSPTPLAGSPPKKAKATPKIAKTPPKKVKAPAKTPPANKSPANKKPGSVKKTAKIGPASHAPIIAAPASKTAMVPTKTTPVKVTPKKAKAIPAKKASVPAKATPPAKTEVKVTTPSSSSKSKTPKKPSVAASKAPQPLPIPSTSTGKATRTPRKPPAHK